MPHLITTSIVTHKMDVEEADVRAALIMEAAEKLGLTHEGTLIKGVEGRVTFEGRRGHSGTYTVHITRNLALSDQPQLPAPGAKAIMP